MRNLTKEEKIIKIIRWLFLFKGVVWIILSGIHLFKGSWLLAGLLFFDAVIFLWLNRVIEKKKRWIFWFAIVFIGVNIFLTITDQFGWFDFFSLVVDCVLFVMIFGNSKKLS